MSATALSPPVFGHTPSAEAFAWDDAFLLGHSGMDHTHREFVHCVRAMLDAPDAHFAAALAAFAEHAAQHFGEEDEAMRASAFPASDCHAQEHAAVMQSVTDVREALANGRDVAVGRGLARELVRWFPGHADYMDAALAHWLVKRSHGGAPVVLRRRAS